MLLGSGNAGGTVLKEVLKTGKPVRAMYRSPQDAAMVPAGAQSAIADFASRPSLGRALAGVHIVYLVCSPVPELVDLEGNVVDACVDAGVRHVVLNSALGAETIRSLFQAGTAGWKTSSKHRAWNIQFCGRTASCKTF